MVELTETKTGKDSAQILFSRLLVELFPSKASRARAS